MKFNWGTGITIFIIAFMLFILFMVFKATQAKSDLYSEDYYSQEISYQKKIDAINNTKKLRGVLSVSQQNDSILINFPSDFNNKEVLGSILFFKPNNAKLDKVYSISSIATLQKVSKSDLTKGNYTLKIECTVSNTPYFFEQTILIE